MDTFRGPFDTFSSGDEAEDNRSDQGESASVEHVRDIPPQAIGQDERRMQVRAYNYWASLLDDGSFPMIEDLDPLSLPDFGSNSVLLDFSRGIEDPDVRFLGDQLAGECRGANIAVESTITKLSDVPPRSLLSRITDHYLQIIASESPIGFEAEFVNAQGLSVLYRGILLPFSSDGETIDFIFGVINWKEIADADAADELLLEIDQAIGADGGSDHDATDDVARHSAVPVTEWADSPAQETDELYELTAELSASGSEDDLDGIQAPSAGNAAPGQDIEPLSPALPKEREGGRLSKPDFSAYSLDDEDFDEHDEDFEEGGSSADDAAYSFASLADYIEAPSKKAIDLDAEHFDPEDYRIDDDDFAEASEQQGEDLSASLDPQVAGDHSGKAGSTGLSHPLEMEQDDADTAPANSAEQEPDETIVTDAAAVEVPPAPTPPAPLPEDADLREHLASAQELAHSARVTEDRSRQTLYAAVGRAYDFSIAASQDPAQFGKLIEESGLTVQDRAPMTPIVKLVFGADYDKTRLTEYAAVLSHAHRVGIERGTLPTYLREAEGGLKGVVNAERRERREEAGKTTDDEGEVRAALAEKLRELEALMLDAISADGPEFSIAVLRRDGSGNVALIGEIGDDVPLIERAAKKLVG